MNRRVLLGHVGAGAAAGVFAAGGPAALAQSARAITFAQSQEPPTLGYGIGNAYVNEVVKHAIGSEPGLTRRNDINDWFPFLAETTPTIENGGAYYVGDGADRRLEVAFDMRRDVRWSDGTPITGHDVKFAWELMMNPDYPVPDRVTEQKVASMEVIDDYRVVIRFMTQNEARDAAANGRNVTGPLPAPAFAEFATQNGPVLDPDYYKDWPAFPRHVIQPIIDAAGVAGLAQHNITRAPLGVGPFKVTQWVPGQFIITEAVPGYFLGAPRANSLVFRFFSDVNAILAQAATGEVDIVDSESLTEFNAPDLTRLESQRRIRAIYTPGTTWEHVDLNLDNRHLSDARVRKAIAHAINRQLIVDRVLNGKTTVIHSWSPAWRWDYNPEVTKYDYNPQKAKDLLKEAGYTAGRDGILVKDGQRLALKYQTTPVQVRQLVSQIVQANLKEVGIEINLEYVPATEYFAAGDNPGPLWGRRFEMGQYAWVAEDDPAGTKNIYGSSGIPSRENSYVGQNFPGFRDPRNDQLLADSENTLDQEARRAIYADQQKLWADALPAIPLYARANVTAMKRSLQNFRPTPTNTPPTWNAHDWYLAE
jgi:peptide/nickel transport system substrate-binding protein